MFIIEYLLISMMYYVVCITVCIMYYAIASSDVYQLSSLNPTLVGVLGLSSTPAFLLNHLLYTCILAHFFGAAAFQQ